MTQTLSRPRSKPFTAADLHERAREVHLPRVIWMNIGWLSVVCGLALTVLGIAAMNTIKSAPGQPDFAMKQAVFLGIGLVAAACLAVPHYRWLHKLSYPLLIVVLALLVFVLVPWVPESIVRPRNGARRWISLIVTDVQPSETAKIAFVLALASYLRYRDNYRTLSGLLLPLALTFVPMALVLVEPDLGTALLFLPTLFAMLIAAGSKLKHVVLIVVLGLSAAPLMYPLLEPHQKDRIHAHIAQIVGDDRYVQDIGFQGAQAMTLVGAGGLTGVGRRQAADLIAYNHLPEEHNDMIFAVICCRWGLLGALATWMLFALFCAGGALTAGLCKDPFGRLVAVGVTALVFAQMAVNTGMTIGLMPITGMTLPFVSYGGSSLVATWMMVGLLLNIAMRRPQYLTRRSFEFDERET